MRRICLLLIVFLVAGCASKTTTEPDASLEWRLRSLEESSLAFKEALRKQEMENERLRNKLEERVLDLESRQMSTDAAINGLDVRFAEVQAEVEAAKNDLMIKIGEPSAKPEDILASSSDSMKSPAAVASAAPVETPPVAKKTVVPMPSASDPQSLYSAAVALVQAEQFPEGRAMLDKFLQKYPDSDLVPNAYYWLGETYYGEKSYAQSILTFREVTRRFPKHNKAAAALLKTGYAYEKLGDNGNARFYLQALLDEFPASEPARLARQRLRELPR